MTEDELKKGIVDRYTQVYRHWTNIRVTTLVPDVFGKNLAVVKATEPDGEETEGEICFVTKDGKVTIFQTTEDLAEALKPEIPPDPKMVDEAKAEIADFSETFKRRHGRNFGISAALVICGILLALSVTAAGFFSYGVLAGVLGLLVTLFLALQNAFSFSEKSEFQRLLFTEADNLMNLLKFRVKTQAQFDAVIDAFMTLNKSAATNLPKGKGIEVVKEMYGSAPEGLRR